MRYGFKEIPLEMEQDGIETRGVECGEVYSRYIDLPAGVDFTPLLVGWCTISASARTGGTCWKARSPCDSPTATRR